MSNHLPTKASPFTVSGEDRRPRRQRVSFNAEIVRSVITFDEAVQDYITNVKQTPDQGREFTHIARPVTAPGVYPCLVTLYVENYLGNYRVGYVDIPINHLREFMG
jgi:hypothetical protein